MPEAMDKYYGLRYETPATLLDHLRSPIFILDEVGGIRDAQKATEFRRSEELTGLLEEGVLCPGLDVLYQTMDDLAIAAQKQSTLLCENFLRGMNEFKLKDLVNAEAFAAPNWGGDLASLREDLDPLVAQGYAVVLFAGTPKGAAALTRDFCGQGLRRQHEPGRPAHKGAGSGPARPPHGRLHLPLCPMPRSSRPGATVWTTRPPRPKSARKIRTPSPACRTSSPATMWCIRATASVCMRASSALRYRAR